MGAGVAWFAGLGFVTRGAVEAFRGTQDEAVRVARAALAGRVGRGRSGSGGAASRLPRWMANFRRRAVEPSAVDAPASHPGVFRTAIERLLDDSRLSANVAYAHALVDPAQRLDDLYRRCVCALGIGPRAPADNGHRPWSTFLRG